MSAFNSPIATGYLPTLTARVQEIEDGQWVATIDECPGCWNDGDTPEQAFDGLGDVLRGWLAVAKRFRHEGIDLPTTLTFTGQPDDGRDA